MPDFNAKMHQNRFRLGLRLRPAGGAYSAPPDLLAGFQGPTSKGREREGTGGQGRGKKGRGRKGRGARPVCLLVLRGGKGKEGEEEREGG